jgi:hypothetical protein
MVFDSSTLILFLNAALTEQPTALLTRALEESAAVISAVTRAEVLAWPSHTVTSLNNATALLDAENWGQVFHYHILLPGSRELGSQELGSGLSLSHFTPKLLLINVATLTRFITISNRTLLVFLTEVSVDYRVTHSHR